MIKSQTEFRGKFLIRKNTGKPDRTTTLSQSIPRAPVYHFFLSTDTLGPEPTDLIINAITTNSNDLSVAVSHVEELPNEPKDTMFGKKLPNADKLIREYHKKQRQFSRVFDLNSTLKKNAPVMINYQLLQDLYPIRNRNQDTYRWVELQWWKAIWDTTANIKTDRMQFISIFTPRVLRPLDYYYQILKTNKLTELRKIRNREDCVLLDLFGFYTQLKEDSIMGDAIRKMYPSLYLDPEQRKKLKNPELNEPNLILAIRDDINVIYLDIRQFVEWALDGRQNEQQRMEWIYGLFESNIDKRVVLEDNIEETYHEEVIRIKEEAAKDTPVESVRGVTDAVLEEADALLASGAISEGEYKGNVKLAKRYESLTNPYTGEPIPKAIIAAESDSIAAPSSTVPDMKVIDDKSYLSNKVMQIDKEYITKHLDNDVMTTIMQLPREGVIVTNVKMEETKDAANHDVTLIVQTKPVKGDVSTFRITYPKIYPDGTFLSGGVHYRMNKQRSELPLIKVEPAKVALSSAMGKMFMRRGFMEVDNSLSWYTKQINILETEGKLSNCRRGNSVVPDMDINIPEIYSMMSSRFRTFFCNDYDFSWDYKDRCEYFSIKEGDLKKIEKSGVVCARKGKTLITVGEGDLFYQLADGKSEMLGKLEDLLGIDASKKPMEWAGVKIKGKVFPVGAILAYYMGIEAFFKYLGVRVREYERNVRIPTTTGMIIRFKDCKITVDCDNRTQELLVAGFKNLKMGLDGTNYENLNKKNAWVPVFATRGCGNSQIRELTRIQRCWIDPITKKLLIKQGEPTKIIPLLIRATELLTNRQHVDESDGSVKVNKGYDRLNDIIYRELLTGVRELNRGNATAKRTFSINPRAVKLAIITDEGCSPTESTNPFQVSGEQDRITFGGAGGRSAVTLVGRHRKFSRNDMGIIGEGFTDSGKAGTILYYSNNPNVDSVYGTVDSKGPKKLGNLVSAAALLSPFSMKDD